jgi:AAA+ superfamily predicted ATPase
MGINSGGAEHPLAVFLDGLSAYPSQQLAVLLALLPELDPGFLGRMLKDKVPEGKDLPAFGGIRGKQHRGVLPTGETLQFLLGGNNIGARLATREVLASTSPLIKSRLLRLLPAPAGEPAMAGQLIIDPDWLESVFTGKVTPPVFSQSFPAQAVETDLNWDDLVLDAKTAAALSPIRNYLEFAGDIEGQAGYGRYARRGYRALFHGPPGTGKTLTAGLLGRAAGRMVFRVDLSMVVSKYIGETEKNLAGLFEKAEHKGWILFFDEADALFGKRTETKDSKDRYANQEISFLLQRVENYDGLVILATNFRNNLDKAFTRRFEAIVPFCTPGPEERVLLWQKMLPANLPPAANSDWETLARRYDLSGAAIANLLRHATLECVARGDEELSDVALMEAIRREFEKEDRMFPG